MFTKLLPEQIKTKLEFIEHYKSANNAADSSLVDANANVTTKNIATLQAELHKDFNIQLNRADMYNRLEKAFGENIAKEYLSQLENHIIYTHDESATPGGVPYCASVSLFPFLQKGLLDFGEETKAPKHSESFCDGFTQLISILSGQFAGAIATPEVLLAANLFFEKDYGIDYLETSVSKIENHLQSIVYNINHKASSRSFQSSFTNFAIFDKYFTEALFGKFIFPDGSKPNFENFEKLQRFFLAWIRKEREKALLTFPVITVAIQNENNDAKDKDFAEFIAEELSKGNSFFLYQSDSVDALSSCCFTGETEVIISNAPTLSKVVSFEEAYQLYIHDPSYKDMKIYHMGNFLPGKVVRLPKGNKKIYEIHLEMNSVIYATEDHIHLTQRGNVDSKNLLESDCLIVYFNKTTHLSKIYSIKEVANTDEYVYCFEMEDKEKPYFTLANGIVTHNCRLKNVLETNEFSYTLGNIGVMTGSVHVITLNINRFIQRIMQDFGYTHEIHDQRWTAQTFKSHRDRVLVHIAHQLKNQIFKMHKYHIAFRQSVEEMIQHKMLPAYDAGFIALSKQFSTIGINGIVEACEFLGLEISNNPDYINFVSGLLKIIADCNKESNKEYRVKFNTEFVPAENLGVKNAKWDRESDYYSPRDCYNSYFFRVEEDIESLDKFVLHGKEMTENLDGGSALHLNLEEHLSAIQYRKLIKIAAETGCYYWTINVLTSICSKCNHIEKKKVLICPKCGSNEIDYATRIIGYLKKIKDFSKERRMEANRRFQHGREELGAI